MRLKDLQKRYLRQQRWVETRRATLGTELAEAQARVAAIQHKLDVLKSPSWIDFLVKPLAEALAKRFKDRELELLGPFGMGSKVPVWLRKKGTQGVEDILGFEVCPGDLDKAELRVVDTATDTGRYQPGTIGEMNGFNHPEETVPPSAGPAWFKKRLA